MINFDDPSIAIALLLIIAGLRLALYVFERMHLTEQAEKAVPLISPDDVPDEITAPSEAPAPTQPPHHRISNPYRFINEVLEAAFIAVFLVFLLIRPFVLQAFFIPSGSMKPTLLEGDKLLAAKFTYRLKEPRHQDIVVFHAPREAIETLSKEQYDPKHPTDYVKRVIGVPGDHIRIVKNDGVYINGEKSNEPYIAEIPDYNYPTDEEANWVLSTENDAYREVLKNLRPYIIGEELVVPTGYLFVLGDNRNLSHDGHKWGLLPRSALIGKAVFIFWPPKRIGFVR